MTTANQGIPTPIIIRVHVESSQIHPKTMQGGTSLSDVLSFVDLAGSEKFDDGNTTLQRSEGTSIKTGLFYLKQMVNGQYSFGNLCLILRDSIRGNCKTGFVCTIALNQQETRQTIEFAEDLKPLTTKPKVNKQKVSAALIRAVRNSINAHRLSIPSTSNEGDELNALKAQLAKAIEERDVFEQYSQDAEDNLRKARAEVEEVRRGESKIRDDLRAAHQKNEEYRQNSLQIVARFNEAKVLMRDAQTRDRKRWDDELALERSKVAELAKVEEKSQKLDSENRRKVLEMSAELSDTRSQLVSVRGQLSKQNEEMASTDAILALEIQRLKSELEKQRTDVIKQFEDSDSITIFLAMTTTF